MAYTYSKLADTTVGAGGASAITFNNIPQNYTDLILKISARTNRADGVGFDNINLQFNGSAIGYSMRLLYGTGTNALSVNSSTTAATFQYATSSNATTATFGNSELYIPNYTGNTLKSFISDSAAENNSTGNNDTILALSVSLWSNTTAINRITLTGASNFAQYSTATLYGIRVEL